MITQGPQNKNVTYIPGDTHFVQLSWLQDRNLQSGLFLAPPPSVNHKAPFTECRVRQGNRHEQWSFCRGLWSCAKLPEILQWGNRCLFPVCTSMFMIPGYSQVWSYWSAGCRAPGCRTQLLQKVVVTWTGREKNNKSLMWLVGRVFRIFSG